MLEIALGGDVGLAIEWHVKALAIRLRIGVPEAAIDLNNLAVYRDELGPERFTGLLAHAADDTDLAETITSLRRAGRPRALGVLVMTSLYDSGR
jgi:hypothetical protein